MPTKAKAAPNSAKTAPVKKTAPAKASAKKSDLKTKPRAASVEAFIDAVPNETRRKDARTLLSMMKKVTGEKATLWGPSIIGFGSYHYRYASGHEGDMCRAGFSPRKGSHVLYVLNDAPGQTALLKRLGKFTFADALNSRFNSRGIKLAAGTSTLAVSLFYLIPQMVGAGVLVQPLLGLPHWAGVVLVGAVVIFIVVTAGMVSTTWVQFIKGSLLVAFSAVLTVLILARGFHATTSPVEPQTVVKRADGQVFVNGRPFGSGPGQSQLAPVGLVSRLPGGVEKTGPLGPLEFFSTLEQSEVVLTTSKTTREADGSTVSTYTPNPTPGSQVLRPGASPTFAGIRSGKLFDKLNFLSLMLALFCGTASLPHILIRYYTVKDEAAARKSTIVGIACIGFFYVLTLYMGLGAMTSGALDPTDSNMAAPLLARSFSELLFAVISAIAFTTVLGTVSGLILASAGAVTHDLVESLGAVELTDHERVRIAKMAKPPTRRWWSASLPLCWASYSSSST